MLSPHFYPVSCVKTTSYHHSDGRETEGEADEPIISTRIQQALDKFLSELWVFRYHSEMQWCGFLEPIDWVYVASVVA